jgi:hypothetical protein
MLSAPLYQSTDLGNGCWSTRTPLQGQGLVSFYHCGITLRYLSYAYLQVPVQYIPYLTESQVPTTLRKEMDMWESTTWVIFGRRSLLWGGLLIAFPWRPTSAATCWTRFRSMSAAGGEGSHCVFCVVRLRVVWVGHGMECLRFHCNIICVNFLFFLLYIMLLLVLLLPVLVLSSLCIIEVYSIAYCAC